MKNSVKYFSCPADFKKDTIVSFSQLNQKFKASKIVEVYGSSTEGSISNSGRVVDSLPKMNFDLLKDYIHLCNGHAIKFNYTLNGACLNNLEFSKHGIALLKDHLSTLYSIGVRNLTITIPSLMEMVKKLNLDFKIKASAICNIDSPAKAQFYKDMGVERIVISDDITRKIRDIENIVKVFGSGVEMLVNNLCLNNCSYKIFHYNHESHSSDSGQDIKSYYFNRCSIQRFSKPGNSLRINWVRPEDIERYSEIGIEYFKLQGRNFIAQGDPVKALEHYMSGSFDGNLFDLIFLFSPLSEFQAYLDNKRLGPYIEKFFNNPDFCNHLCNDCGYCDNYINKIIDIEDVSRRNNKTIELYNSIDEYSKLIRSVEPMPIDSGIALDDFDFND